MSDHIREHHSLLAAVEKKLLIRLARRLPTSINSDHLTWLALAAMLAAGVAYAVARWQPGALWVAVAALAVNWFGDSLDGTVARVRGQERPRYGFYVDHVVDIAGITALLGGLACSGFMTPWIALALLAGYLLVAAETFLATACRAVFRLSFAGVGPTELRIVLAVGTIALRGDPHVTVGEWGRLALFDVGGLVALAGLGVAFVWSVARNGTALARLEPRPSLKSSAAQSTMTLSQHAEIPHSRCQRPNPRVAR
jgi:phosphatidylglycerophosphate synthase